MVGVAARIRKRGGRIAMARIGVTGMGRTRFRATECGEAAGKRRGRGSGGSGGGRRRGRQLRPVRLCRIPAASGAGTRGARDCSGALEGVVKISGAYRRCRCRGSAPMRCCRIPAVLARCMPGCESLDKTGEDEYAMRMKMVLAAFPAIRRQGADHRTESAAQFPAARGRHGQDRLHERRRAAQAVRRGRRHGRAVTMATCKSAAPSRQSDSA